MITATPGPRHLLELKGLIYDEVRLHELKTEAMPGFRLDAQQQLAYQFALVVVMNDPSNGSYYGGAVSAPVFSQIMGDVLRLENVMPDGMPQGAENLIVMHDSHPLAPAL
ncbi:hypothetical protein AE02_04594 [Klebsiella variicola]|nr:hypothetical protein AE02_04594 [Klebsiella variicola]